MIASQVGVHESFMACCAAAGADETVRIYREHIQADERIVRDPRGAARVS